MLLKLWHQHENGEVKPIGYHVADSVNRALDLYPSSPEVDPDGYPLPWWDLYYQVVDGRRYYYAAHNSYGVNFTYDSPGWSVHAFESKAARKAWVDDDDYPNGNPTREPITAKTAYKLVPDLRTEYVPLVDEIVMHTDYS